MGIMGFNGEEVMGGFREGFDGWLHNSYYLASITNLLVFVREKICFVFEVGSKLLCVI
jgi:hypothetical protein